MSSGHGGHRSGSGRKRIYSSAVVRNRNWRRGHGRIWSDGIIFSSCCTKLECGDGAKVPDFLMPAVTRTWNFIPPFPRRRLRISAGVECKIDVPVAIFDPRSAKSRYENRPVKWPILKIRQNFYLNLLFIKRTEWEEQWLNLWMVESVLG